jgi:hypothetical protein
LPKDDLEDFEIPPELGKRFYSKLNRLARKYGITRADLLEQALTLYEQFKTQKIRQEKTGVKADDEAIKKMFGAFPKSWWERLTPEEREVESKKRKEAAEARWGKKKA